MIVGETIYLRPVLSSDLRIILEWENNPEFWPVTGVPGPFTEEDIHQFIQQSKNVFEDNQMRWMICSKRDDQPIGALDLFEYDANNKSVGIGILIADHRNRKRGFAHQAIEIFAKFASESLGLKTLHCLIHVDNLPSIQLFEKAGFSPRGAQFFKNKRALKFTRSLSFS
jgi:diamine N-acetyltransferase